LSIYALSILGLLEDDEDSTNENANEVVQEDHDLQYKTVYTQTEIIDSFAKIL
jgi:hypothetical protein